MAWHNCPVCNELRKVDIMSTSDGWSQPPCYNCGDPGYLEPYSTEAFSEDFLDHFGVKGMKWGVRQTPIQILPPAKRTLRQKFVNLLRGYGWH
jgi:hypothetical protein